MLVNELFSSLDLFFFLLYTGLSGSCRTPAVLYAKCLQRCLACWGSCGEQSLPRTPILCSTLKSGNKGTDAMITILIWSSSLRRDKGTWWLLECRALGSEVFIASLLAPQIVFRFFQVWQLKHVSVLQLFLEVFCLWVVFVWFVFVFEPLQGNQQHPNQ